MSYARSAKIYDALYAAMGKDYEKESKQVHAFIQQHKRSGGKSLLDVACGTGKHLEHLKAWYDVEGLDLEEQMLTHARERLPKIKFHHADMIGFDLGREYDAVLCLFSSIGYAVSLRRLHSTILNMTKHLRHGGVLIIEPWFKPSDWKENYLHATFVNEPDLKVARMSISRREGILAVMEMNYTVATTEGVEHFKEVHKMALFTHDEYLEAFRKVGLEVHYDEEGLVRRGLYIGVKN